MTDIVEKLAQEAAELMDRGEFRDGKWYSEEHRQAWKKAMKPAADEIERLRGLNTWQPIETAPRDGTRFLVYCPHSCERWVEIAVWDDGSELHNSWRVDAIAPPYGDEDEFTHWMPLPEPPKEK